MLASMAVGVMMGSGTSVDTLTSLKLLLPVPVSARKTPHNIKQSMEPLTMQGGV